MAYVKLEIALSRAEDGYRVELRHEDPSSRAQVAPVRGSAPFELVALLEHGALPELYGRTLAQQLFAEPAISERFVQIETAAQARRDFLRIKLRVDPSAAELHALRWELLQHPRTHAVLATSERVLLSRFIASHDFRPVTVGAKAGLRALVAISAPAATKQLAAVDYAGELARARAALAGVELRVIGGPEHPFTVDRFMAELRDGADLVYVVSHGTFGQSKQSPALVLQDAEDPSKAKMVTAQELARRFGELQELPRLMVLMSCESAGTGEQVDSRTAVQASLAVELANAGVPAILAMQGFITMQTAAQMMPVLFTELLRDGQIDRALAVARGRVRGRVDAWMPALFCRLSDGRLWHVGGLSEDVQDSLRWQHAREIIDFSAERNRHEHFFGREDIFAELDTWLRGHESGWVVITGGPGLGKSALLDRWLRRREDTQLLTASHFIRRGHLNWAEPEAVRANLAAQIEQLFPDQRDADAQPSSRLETLLGKVSPELAKRGQQLVLLVDGLDEAITLGAANPIPQMFPLEVPAGVCVVVASRPKYPHLNWLDRRTGVVVRIDLDQRAVSNEAAVRGYWSSLGPKMLPPLTAELERAAVERAHGNLLHAVKLRELWSRAGSERSVESVPEGFEGMLEELWTRIGELPEAELEKDPNDRPRDANEIVERLIDCVPMEMFKLPAVTETAHDTAISALSTAALDAPTTYMRIEEAIAEGEPRAAQSISERPVAAPVGAAVVTPDDERAQLMRGCPPRWAGEWGEDELGIYASIVVAGVVQCMRWVSGGQFWMGSSETEAGHSPHEGPLHKVILQSGYWMADTPCTQALWIAVMGSNPSLFQSSQRPVERVSWDDVREFLQRVSMGIPGLNARLPTEAEWEHACRAGTEGAVHAGSMGDGPSPIDPLAWYDQNSPHGGTHDVKHKLPNKWGIYDMLGNVWEWCEDGFRDYGSAVTIDPVGPQNNDRVTRGGSWNSGAHRVRAASRLWPSPTYRHDDCGFRFVRGRPTGP